MKHSLGTVLHKNNLSFSLSNIHKKSSKSLNISSIRLWRFLLIFELLSNIINSLLFFLEFLSHRRLETLENEKIPILIGKFVIRFLQLSSILIFWQLSRKFSRKISFRNALKKIFVVINSHLDLFIFCHLDMKLLRFEAHDFDSFFIILKIVIVSLFLEKILYLYVSSALGVFYYSLWTSLSLSKDSFFLIKSITYASLIIILIFGASYCLKRKKEKSPHLGKKLLKDIFHNPFLEIIPEAILIVKEEDLSLIYHNQYLFHTLEIEKFMPLELKEISLFLVNFKKSKQKELDFRNIIGRSPKLSKSFQIFTNLFEILESGKTGEDLSGKETNERLETDKDEAPTYYVADRIDPKDNDKPLFQIEVTIKKIVFKKESHFLIMLQSLKLKKIVQELTEKDDFKTRLLCSFSHDLKTPLNGTIPYLELLLDETGIREDIKEKYIKTSLSSLKLLQSSLNDIMDYSLILSDQLILNIKPINVMNLILDVEDLIKPLLEAKNIDLSTNFININQNLLIYSDRSRISQILLNLLKNSIKFTNSGGRITLHVISDIVNYVENLSFEIKDTGIGISDENLLEINSYLEKIAANSEQNLHLNLNTTGSGFGLRIGQSLALIIGPNPESIEGGLKIESLKGQGTSVKFVVTDKKHMLLDSKSSFSRINKSLRPNTTIIMDSVKIEFLRQINRSIQKSHRSENSMNSINHSANNVPTLTNFRAGNEFDSILNNINIEGILQDHNFNEGIKFLSQIMIREETKIDSIKSDFFEDEKRNSELVLPDRRKLCDCEDILAVDDDIFNLLSLEMLLKSWNLRIKRAMNGEEAVKIMKTHYQVVRNCCKRFRLIIMDYQMPIMDGVEATKELMELMKMGKIPNIPIIGCTAFVTKTEINKCFEAGMKDVVFKPLNKQVISEIISNWVH